MAGTFISYRWESEAFRAAVRALAERLRAAGVEVVLDQLYFDEFRGGPNEGWAMWCSTEIKRAERVLVVCSPGWFRCFEGTELPGQGLGAAFEARLIFNELSQLGFRSGKHRFLTLPGHPAGEVPVDFIDIHRFDSEREFDGMVEWLGVQALRPEGAAGEERPVWPEPLADFRPEFADRDEIWPHIPRLLSGRAERRILIVEGETNHGKSLLLREGIRYAEQAGVGVVSINCEGGHSSMADILAEIDLNVGDRLPLFHASAGRDRFALRKDLRALKEPVLLLLDNYEEQVNPEVTNWIEHQLLNEVEHSPALAVIVAGEECPRPEERRWGRAARSLALGPILDVEAWRAWVERRYPALRDEYDVRGWVHAAHGNPSSIVNYLEATAEFKEQEALKMAGSRDLSEVLEALESASGDPRAQAAIVAELALRARPEAEARQLLAAFDAAAVLRWFNAELLAGMLELSPEGARRVYRELEALPFVEAYAAAGVEARHVHGATRLGWRRRLAKKDLPKLRRLSARAASRFERRASPREEIEWLYHLFVVDPPRAVAACEEIGRAWGSVAHPEDRQALALALEELESTGLVEGWALIEVSLFVLEARSARGEDSRLLPRVEAVLKLAGASDHPSGEARALALLGDVQRSLGNPKAALTSFEAAREIMKRLTSGDPENGGWQRDLAVVYAKLGDTHAELETGTDAVQASYAAFLDVMRTLAAKNPENASLRRDLGVAHSRVGDGHLLAEDPESARTSFESYLTITQALVAEDSGNANWQRELSVALTKLGDVQARLGNKKAARESYEADLEISERLAAKYPANPISQVDLAVTHTKLADLHREDGELDAARTSFETAREILEELVEVDPRNVVWSRELAFVHQRMADVFEAQSDFEKAAKARAAAAALGKKEG